jgi:malonyl-CoA decarboxylase
MTKRAIVTAPPVRPGEGQVSPPTGPGRAHAAPPAKRPLAERLDATFRRGEEALSPRELRQHAGRAAGHRRSARQRGRGRAPRQEVASGTPTASPEERRDLWLLMSEQFMADPRR